MANYTSLEEIGDFLEMAKQLVVEGKYDFVPRRKNMQALAAHGLTILDAKEEVLALTVADYYKGPKKDFERMGEIWEFKRKVDGIQFYIKIKITQDEGENILKCLGFHEDEFC